VGDCPIDEDEEADGNRVLAVEVPEEVIADYEWIEELKGYREWLVPAKVPNRYPVTEVSAEALDALEAARWDGLFERHREGL
jgi:hypothetical protein